MRGDVQVRIWGGWKPWG